MLKNEISLEDALKYGTFFIVKERGSDIFIFEPDRKYGYFLNRIEVRNQLLFTQLLLEQVSKFEQTEAKVKEPTKVSQLWKHKK